MKRPVKIYFDSLLYCLIITKTRMADRSRYHYISSCETVPNAETRAEQMTEDDGDIMRPMLDVDLVDESGYWLSGEDICAYCYNV